MPLSTIAWLRRLISDVPAMHHDLAMGDGSTTAFYLAAGAATAGTVIVTVNDALQELGADYQLTPGLDGIVFDSPPPDEARVRIGYSNTEWDDDTLETFLAAAGQRYDVNVEMVLVIYQAAIYAIDTALIGLATALNFGAGAEQFDMASVFNRLLQLRDTWLAFITEQLDSTAVLSFVDVHLDLDDPSPFWWVDESPIGWVP